MSERSVDRETAQAPVTLADLRRAQALLSPHLLPTPSLRSDWLSELRGEDVWVKWESLQRTGSFKLRGALYKLLRMRERGEEGRGVLAVSAGNHGLGVAHAASLLGVRATVVVPENAAPTKVRSIARYGVELIVLGADYDAAEAAARALSIERGVAFVSPYNDHEIIVGQATATLEFLDETRVDTLIVPVGGGGLLAGAALAIRALSSAARLVGAQPEGAPAMHHALAAGEIVPVLEQPTLADGLAGNIEAGAVTFPIIARHVPAIVLVAEASIAGAIRGFLAHEHMVVEGSAAVGAAAILEGAADLRGTVGLLVTGRNLDLARLEAILAQTAAP